MQCKYHKYPLTVIDLNMNVRNMTSSYFVSY